MAKKAKRTLNAQFLPCASCDDCDWTWPHSRDARDEAKFHTENEGHTTVVEIITRDVYEASGP